MLERFGIDKQLLEVAMALPMSPVEGMNYEQAMSELEDITRSLEENPPALEDTLALFERGQALARRCADLLNQAELKVRQLSAVEMEGLAGE
jgi:exodeoxyribonuclease VII small subunit